MIKKVQIISQGEKTFNNIIVLKNQCCIRGDGIGEKWLHYALVQKYQMSSCTIIRRKKSDYMVASNQQGESGRVDYNQIRRAWIQV